MLFLPLLSICQTKPYEIFGKIEGEYLGKVHLIFDKITATNDSLVAEIKDGKFYFKGTVPYMPILAIFRLSHSPFVRVYIDGPQTHIDFSNKVNVQGNYSSQLFKAVKVTSSHTNSLLFDFEKKRQEIERFHLDDAEKKEALTKQLSQFIKQHPKNKLSAYLLSQADYLSHKQAKASSALLDASLHQTTEWGNVKRLLDDLYKPQFLNTLFYDVVLQDQNFKDVDTRMLQGKLTLVVFWASWCRPCRAEHPDFNRFYKSYKANGLQIVSISLDKSKEAWMKAIAKDHLIWPQLIDLKNFEGELAKHYGIGPLPSNFLLDQDRKIIGIDLSVREIEDLIGRLLP